MSITISSEQASMFSNALGQRDDKRKELSSPVTPDNIQSKRSSNFPTPPPAYLLPTCTYAQPPAPGISSSPSSDSVMTQMMFTPEFLTKFSEMLAPSLASLVSQLLLDSMKPLIDQAVHQAVANSQVIHELIDSKVSDATASMKLELGRQASEIAELRDTVSVLQVELDEQQQYTRRGALKFHNVPIDKPISEFDTYQAVLDICNKLGVHLTKADLSRTHTIGRVRNNKVTIIARFVRYTDRQAIFKVKSDLKSQYKDEKIFISECLTPFRQGIVNELGKLWKDNIIESHWTMDGRIFAKKTKTSPKLLITSYECVHRIASTSHIQDRQSPSSSSNTPSSHPAALSGTQQSSASPSSNL